MWKNIVTKSDEEKEGSKRTNDEDAPSGAVVTSGQIPTPMSNQRRVVMNRAATSSDRNTTPGAVWMRGRGGKGVDEDEARSPVNLPPGRESIGNVRGKRDDAVPIKGSPDAKVGKPVYEDNSRHTTSPPTNVARKVGDACSKKPVLRMFPGASVVRMDRDDGDSLKEGSNKLQHFPSQWSELRPGVYEVEGTGSVGVPEINDVTSYVAAGIDDPLSVPPIFVTDRDSGTLVKAELAPEVGEAQVVTTPMICGLPRKDVIFALLFSCVIIVVGWAVYYYTSSTEQEEFVTQFQEDAIKVLSTLGSNMELILQALDAFAMSIVSHARVTNQTWPFVVIADFAARADKILALTDAVYINIYPFVDVDQREEWELLTSKPESHSWVNESIKLQEANPRNVWPILWNYTMWDRLFGYEDLYQGFDGPGTNRTGPYMPLWQIHPVIGSSVPVYNWDLYSLPDTEGQDLVLETHKVTLSKAWLINEPDDPPEAIQYNIDEAAWLSDYLTTDEDPMEPLSSYKYPVIDRAVEMLNTNDEDAYDVTENNVVALLVAEVYWRDALKDILPDGSEGIVAVFENACNPTFTYQIDGGRVNFLGSGDQHDTTYDSLRIFSRVNDLRNLAIRRSSYSGRPVNEDHCPFNVTLYPSSMMESHFVTNKPTQYTVGAVLIFAFTSVVFILYDHWPSKEDKQQACFGPRQNGDHSNSDPRDVTDQSHDDC